MLEWLKAFSVDYANGVMAIAAVGALVLAAITLWYLKREYLSKYRPYIFPVVHAEPMPEKTRMRRKHHSSKHRATSMQSPVIADAAAYRR